MRKKGVTSDYVTRDILEETLDLRLSFFKEEIVNTIKDIFTKINSNLYSRIDLFLSQILTLSENRKFTTEKLVDNEKRIKKLEIN